MDRLDRFIVPDGEAVNLAFTGTRERRSYLVLKDCGGTENGHWACETHPKAWLPHGLALHTHIESGRKHRIVWVCHEHGPESVATD